MCEASLGLFGRLVLFLTVGLAPLVESNGIEIPTIQIKKTVAFIYTVRGSNDVPDGTGFFMAIPRTTNEAFVYLVTAKHVVQMPDKTWLSEIRVRVNRAEGPAIKVVSPLIHSGTNKNVFVHSDPGVDLAVIPWTVPSDGFDYGFLSVNMLASRSDMERLGVREGTEVFFAGMFVYHLGSKQNIPMLRFGKIALVGDEKISFGGEDRDLLLIEANSFGGNSGSPVFYLTGFESPPGLVLGQPRSLLLAGVLSGRFNDEVLVQTIPTTTTNATFPSMGITAVVPAEKLRDILFSEELKNLRKLP
jgi:hypothetical protein